ncbi:MAG: hypothetical protein JKX76_01625 [Colwellia sp.]|nr:hypothetical protein [Colwellia sp.]
MNQNPNDNPFNTITRFHSYDSNQQFLNVPEITDFDNISLPNNFKGQDIWKGILSEPGDQGSCGSCWSFATSSALADRFNILMYNSLNQKFESINLSPVNPVLCDWQGDENIISLRDDGGGVSDSPFYSEIFNTFNKKGIEAGSCYGNTLEDAWRYLYISGTPTTTCMPYDLKSTSDNNGIFHTAINNFSDDSQLPLCYDVTGKTGDMCIDNKYHAKTGLETGTPAKFYRAKNFYRVGNDNDSILTKTQKIMEEIYIRGPVTSGIDIYPSFYDFNPVSDVYDRNQTLEDNEEKISGHAIEIVGWGESKQDGKFWHVKNSWGCYDAFTQILTKNGWKYFFDLEDDESVATLTPSKTLEYNVIDSKQVFHNNGENMHYWSGTNLDLVITYNHKIYVESNEYCTCNNSMENNIEQSSICPYNMHTGLCSNNQLVISEQISEYTLIESWKLSHKQTFIKNIAINNLSNTPESPKGTGTTSLNQESFRFCTSEQSSDNESIKESYFRILINYVLYGKKIRYHNQTRNYENIFTSQECNPSEAGLTQHNCGPSEAGLTRCEPSEAGLTGQSDDSNVFEDQTENIQIVGILKEHQDKFDIINFGIIPRYSNLYIIIKSDELYNDLPKLTSFPREILDIEPKYLNIMKEEIFKKSSEITVKSLSFANGIQELIFMAGFTSVITKTVCNITDDFESNTYTVKLIANTEQVSPPELKPYFGNIYCVNVKNHIIYVRRNGKPVWCGNSDWGERGYFRMRRGEDLCGIESGVISGEPDLFDENVITIGETLVSDENKTVREFVDKHKINPKTGYSYRAEKSFDLSVEPESNINTEQNNEITSCNNNIYYVITIVILVIVCLIVMYYIIKK